MGRKTVLKNKLRGRVFQAKLAQMASGLNVGTLGGEDVMHEKYSYEAKTYDPKAKTNNGPWRGRVLLDEVNYKYSAVDGFNGVRIIFKNSASYDNALCLVSWTYWQVKHQTFITWRDYELSSFIGRSWMRQAEANCPDSKIPIVVVHQIGDRHMKDIVMVREFYFYSLMGE